MGCRSSRDTLREADEDNPRGYFEHEAVKAMFRDQSWLTEARGKALKVVVPLVRNLPTGCNYRIVLIDRDDDEILASQAKMIARRGESIEDTPDRGDRLRREYARLIAQTRASWVNVKTCIYCRSGIETSFATR